MIPQEKSAAVYRGLQAAFGTTTIENICAMTRGLSSDLVFRVLVKGSPYLLRVMTRINEQLDPARIFACMQAASDADITPRVHYTSAEDGISITDFVEGVPLPASRALHLLPRKIRILHDLPRFPKEFNYVTAHNGFISRLRSSGLLPQSQVEEVYARYERICAVYPRVDSEMVSSHMDLKPDNILFDGDRVWLVDWQAGFVNDRYFDLGVAGSFLIRNDGDESAFLEQYFGRLPDEYQRARFFLMRQFLHVFSASVFLLLGSGGKPISLVEELPSFEEFHRRIWAGDVNMADKDQQIISGLVHWERALKNARHSRLDESLKLVSGRHGEHARKLFPTP